MAAQTRNGTVTDKKIAELEAKLAYCDWLREIQRQQIERLAAAMAGMLAQMAQPQMTQTITDQLLGRTG